MKYADCEFLMFFKDPGIPACQGKILDDTRVRIYPGNYRYYSRVRTGTTCRYIDNLVKYWRHAFNFFYWSLQKGLL